MLDTIRVKWPIAPTQEQLEHWTCRTTRNRKGEEECLYLQSTSLTKPC